MEIIPDFRSAAAIAGGALALVVVVIVVARLLRSRVSPKPMPMPEASPVDSDAAYLDSSHIIDGPLSGATERDVEAYRAAAAQGGDPGKPGGPDAGSRQ